MLKNNKGSLLLSSILILLPILFGLLKWNALPAEIATHWDALGNANGWSSRPFAVFGLPLILLALHWICAWGTSRDPKNAAQSRKLVQLVFWICPVVSLYAAWAVYSHALGEGMPVERLSLGLIGLLFLIFGNYFPKCRRNRTIGLRMKWTLESEENWNATHRVCGKVWVAGGFLLILGCFLPGSLFLPLLLPLLAVLAIFPCVYSWRYHRAHGA